MALDLYSACPCGSGKKFKWCCQPIHVQITKAFEQDAEGQYEAALKTMDQLAAEHPGNPEVWGRKAQLLYQMDKAEEAETALQKALDLNPTYPFGFFLQGKFRQFEGEIAGALILFRKAADLYDPEARNILAQVHALIADCELKLNRPVAGRAALQMAQHFAPVEEDYRKGLEQIFGDKSPYPLSARREYTFQSPPANAPAQKRTSWDQALNSAGIGKLTGAAGAFDLLVKEDPQDAAAWFNLALTRAWQGNNPDALEALEKYIELETDADRADQAWALAEVLRCGQGMEDQADYVEHYVLFGIRDVEGFMKVLARLQDERRLIGLNLNQEEGTLTGLFLEKVQALTPELAARASPLPACYLLMVGNVARLWNVRRDALDKLVGELHQLAGAAMDNPQSLRGPVHFAEILTSMVGIPLGAADQAESNRRVEESCSKYIEETWLHQPLISLNRIPPVDAAGHPVLRKKLRGVVQFLEECAPVAHFPYDFNRLRRKLGLMEGEKVSAAAAAAAAPDISAMSAPELANLSPESLTYQHAEQAWQGAVKLDARELAGKFARNLVARPPEPDRPDRFPFYSQLVQLALAEGNTDAALDYLNEGEKADCEQNEGRRRNDYELRRGQVHARRGEIDQAQDVFDRLIARVSGENRYRGTAAEAMLSAKQPARAQAFAQAGLDQARKQNDRDSEDYFKELLAASQK